ncbi:MAG: alpha/beta hydrolase [Verrucomicrobiales bacterium]|nr:alpha/beta hydrolase [Verrucomicrobiales bacterium]
MVAVLAILAGAVWIYFHPRHERQAQVVYGQRHGCELVFDVLQPRKPNGAGILLLVSGSWRSSTNSFRPWLAAPLLRRGFTVFAVYHVPQPSATVMEIVEDMHRAVRFIRHHARRFGVQPDRLGVAGGSSGGHLALMLATRGGPGPADAPDPVDRESSAVQAVAVFFPVTDLLNLRGSTEDPGDGGPPRNFVRAFGPNSTNIEQWRVIGREVSPIYHITSNLPPTLIYHGDADTLVPLEQSRRFQAEAQKVGGTVNLVVRRGGRHGWLGMLWDIRQFARWFERHLQSDEANHGLPETRIDKNSAMNMYR